MRRVGAHDVLGDLIQKNKASNFDTELIREMLAAVNIVEVMENEYGLFFEESSGGWWNTNCPFPDHRDSDPSFGAHPEKGKYSCFGCNRKGNLINFMREIEGMSFREALLRLSALSGIGPGEDDGGLNRLIRDIDRMVNEYLRIEADTELPGGMSVLQFHRSMAERLRKYEDKVYGDPDEIAWVDSVYQQIDDCDVRGDEAGMTRIWRNLSKETPVRYAAYKERCGPFIEDED